MAFKKVIVTKKNYKVGDKVVRGRDWNYSGQGGNSEYGIISIHPYNEERVMVEWTNGHSNSYSVGGNDKYDLYFYTKELNNSLINRIGHLLK